MKNEAPLTKGLAIVGTVFVWLPILFAIVTSVAVTIATGTFRFDYLIPAELFPITLTGGLLLLWAAWRARLRRAAVGWGLGAMVALLVGSQAIAVATGLASGAASPGGWAWALVLTTLALFWAAIVATGIAGIGLIRDITGK